MSPGACSACGDHSSRHNPLIAARPTRPQTAAGQGAQLVVLPEMWNCPYSNDSFPTYAEDIDGKASPSVDALAQVTLVPRRQRATSKR